MFSYLAEVYVRARALAIFDYVLGARLGLNHDLGAGDGQHLVLHDCVRYCGVDGWNGGDNESSSRDGKGC